MNTRKNIIVIIVILLVLGTLAAIIALNSEDKNANGDNSDGELGRVLCTADVRECADGSYVSRDPKNDCLFKPCPDEVSG